MKSFVAAVAFATTASASWSSNLNYGSPSYVHTDMAISMPKLLKRQAASGYMDPSQLKFTHGVASGDPYADSVILWTRASPTQENDLSNVTVTGNVPLYNHDTEQYIAASKNPVCVDWTISPNKDLRGDSKKGRAYTSSDIDYTLKVEAKGLKPFTTYYYQFQICNSNTKSPLGRTKTAPRENDKTQSVGLAVYSCSNYPVGFFNAYGNAARKDNVDYVVHLGDYLYEYGTSTPTRQVQPAREIFSLGDYRQRIATYRTDLDLLLSHQQYAWIPVWDDHEVSNNGYRDGSSGLNNTEQSFDKTGRMISVDQRKMNAVRSYFEWMPIRQVNMDDNLRIWRSFKMGTLFDLIMLDTRNYDRSITTLTGNNNYIARLANDAGRTMMGGIQENWFYRQLKESFKRGATWRIVGSQVIFSRINQTVLNSNADQPAYNGDAWDGYLSNKNRTLKTLYDNKIGGNIFLAGDTHQNWVSDLVWEGEKAYDSKTGEGALGVEFGGTAVSSNGCNNNITFCAGRSRGLVGSNEELQWQEGYYRGYFELRVTREKVDAKFFGCPSVQTRNGFEISLANFTVEAGGNRLKRPVAGGSVEDGFLKDGQTKFSNVGYDTNTGEWRTFNFTRVTIPPAPAPAR